MRIIKSIIISIIFLVTISVMACAAPEVESPVSSYVNENEERSDYGKNESSIIMEVVDDDLIISGVGVLTGRCEETEARNVVICDGISEIGDGYFRGLRNIRKIRIPGSVERIGEYAFSDCKGLKEVKLGNGVKRICKYSFMNCTSIREFELPESVVEFSSESLMGCKMLCKITNKSSESYDFSEATRRSLVNEKWYSDGKIQTEIGSNETVTVEPRVLKIKYDLNGGKAKSDLKRHLKRGTLFRLPKLIEKESYIFGGWAWSGDEGAGIYPCVVDEIYYPIDKDYSLSAVWLELRIKNMRKKLDIYCKYSTSKKKKDERFLCVLRIVHDANNDAEYLIYNRNNDIYSNRTSLNRCIEINSKDRNLSIDYAFISDLEYLDYIDRVDGADGDYVLPPWEEESVIWKNVESVTV